MPKSTFGRSGGRLLRFWGMFLGKRFLIIFKARKNHPKKLKMQSKSKKIKPMHFFINFLIFHKMRQPPECLYTQQFCGLSTFKIKPTKNAKRRYHLSFWEPFGATWLILGDLWPIWGAIWDPAGRQGAPKIDHFGPKSHQKLKK